MNETFRAAVTETGFVLNLGKTHIAALVWIDCCLRYDHGAPHVRSYDRTPQRDREHPLGRAHSNFKGGVNGLQERGLIVWTNPLTIKLPRGRSHWTELPARRIWKITPAGRLVIGLLKEAGLYEEYASALIIPRLKVVS